MDRKQIRVSVLIIKKRSYTNTVAKDWKNQTCCDDQCDQCSGRWIGPGANSVIVFLFVDSVKCIEWFKLYNLWTSELILNIHMKVCVYILYIFGIHTINTCIFSILRERHLLKWMQFMATHSAMIGRNCNQHKTDDIE
mgnify:CR=1 FL=1